MKTFFDCVPCIVNHSLDSARRATDDRAIHEQVLRHVLRALSETDLCRSPPEMGQQIHRLIRHLTGCTDPYRDAKTHFNRMALALYPRLERCVAQSENPLDTAARLAIAGNVIDLGVSSHVAESYVCEEIERALRVPLTGDVGDLSDAIKTAGRILYLADNAGEIVFDRLLLEQILDQIPNERLAVAVRGGPVLNDATMVDAQEAGLPGLVDVIDNGSDAPGTILAECSSSFRHRFEEADLIIAKGQGNYETLSDAGKDIIFLLKAKCQVIARDLGCAVDSFVLRRSASLDTLKAVSMEP